MLYYKSKSQVRLSVRIPLYVPCWMENWIVAALFCWGREAGQRRWEDSLNLIQSNHVNGGKTAVAGAEFHIQP